MREKLLIVGLMVLFLSAIFISINTIPFVVTNAYNERQPLPLSKPSAVPTIAFITSYSADTPNYYSPNLVMFDVNGTYQFSNDSWVDITNYKGDTVFHYPLRSYISEPYLNRQFNECFPVTIWLDKNQQYVANFENVTFDTDTFLMVYTPYVSQVSLSSDNSLAIGHLFFIIGVVIFSIGWCLVIYDIGKKKKSITGVHFRKEDKFVTQLGAVLSVFSIVALCLLGVMVTSIFFINAIFNLFLNSILVALTVGHIYFSTKKQISIFSLTYEYITYIEEQASTYMLCSGILLVVSSMFLLLQPWLGTVRYFLFVLGLLLYGIAAFIFLITAPFGIILTEKGKLVLPLKKFVESYNSNPTEIEFNLLNKAARRISRYYKKRGLLFPASDLTCGFFGYITSNKTKTKIDALLSQLEKNPIDDVTVIPLLKDFLTEGRPFKELNIKAMPSFVEKYSRELRYFSSILLGITTILSILSYLHVL